MAMAWSSSWVWLAAGWAQQRRPWRRWEVQQEGSRTMLVVGTVAGMGTVMMGH
jgi:hypothetical protein